MAAAEIAQAAMARLEMLGLKTVAESPAEMARLVRVDKALLVVAAAMAANNKSKTLTVVAGADDLRGLVSINRPLNLQIFDPTACHD